MSVCQGLAKCWGLESECEEGRHLGGGGGGGCSTVKSGCREDEG